MTTDVVPIERTVEDRKRGEALLKAIGLDRVPPEQRALALKIAERYDLDLLLKHLVLVDGRPYITRDGLLHVAHRSGQLDGIEVTDPELVEKFWHARASVFRKDMSRPFTYAGRYPAQGGNARYAPEMAVKVAEVMALRRAFDVSAPVIEERWDVDAPPAEPQRPLAERLAERAAEITSPPAAVEEAAATAGARTATPLSAAASADAGSVPGAGEASHPDASKPATCGAVPPDTDPLQMTAPCEKAWGHAGIHRSHEGTWPPEPEAA